MLPSRRCTPRVHVRLADSVSPLHRGAGIRASCRGLQLKSSNTGLPPRYSTVGLQRPRSLSPSAESDSECSGDWTGPLPEAGLTPRPGGTPAAVKLSNGHGIDSEPESPASSLVSTPLAGSSMLGRFARGYGSAAASPENSAMATPLAESSLLGRFARGYSAAAESPAGSPSAMPLTRSRQSLFRLGSPHPLQETTNLPLTDMDGSYSPHKRRGGSWLDSESESPSKRVHIGTQSRSKANFQPIGKTDVLSLSPGRSMPGKTLPGKRFSARTRAVSFLPREGTWQATDPSVADFNDFCPREQTWPSRSRPQTTSCVQDFSGSSR